MESSTRPNNILILCTGNSCRSQIAEGLLKNLLPNVGVYSAGIETHGVNPKAIRVMDEIDIDLRSNTSNHIEEYSDINFDHIITVCDHAAENCPHFPSKAQRHHFNFPDPAKATGSEEEILNQFRSVRHLIKEYLEKFVAEHY
ncbi:MAG: protein tyrosine phosphatase [Crocinitomicaceae bacterium]|nr:protein tyrosine phosphatase [Crocinitomicaceae bacterium]|tara:strand:+ start:386 stop:814 length:429 start_codon:yes stop_codon:yes gene_type:complete